MEMATPYLRKRLAFARCSSHKRIPSNCVPAISLILFSLFHFDDVVLRSHFTIVTIEKTAQPALTELETIMMDWLGRALHLPKQFLFKESKGKGGGNTQASASDALFSVFTTARFTKLKELGCYSLSNSITCDDPVPPCKFMDRLVAYTSTEAHSCIEKAANIAMIEIRLLKPNQNRQMTAEILEEAIVQDIKHDRIPLLFAATMGTTGTGAIDDIEGCGVVCQKYGIWFHVGKRTFLRTK